MASDNLVQLSRLLDKKLDISEKRVVGEVGKFIEDNLVPMIEEKADKSDIDRIERKLDKVIDSVADHERRVKSLEGTSSVPH